MRSAASPTAPAQDTLRTPSRQGSGQVGGDQGRRPPQPSRSHVSQPAPCPSPGKPRCAVLSTPSFGRRAMLRPMVSAGGRCAAHPARWENAPLCPVPPPCAWRQRCQARLPQSSRVCALGVGRGRMGRACPLLKAHSVFLSQNGNFQNPLAPVPCSWRGPVPGGVCARGWVLPPAGGREIRPR